ncbi:MAG: hypothetical protein ACRC6P_21085 [Shewanella oncorhynchi]
MMKIIIKFLLIFAVFIGFKVKADEFTIMCNSCSYMQYMNTVSEYSYANGVGLRINNVVVVDVDNGSVKKFRVSVINGEPLGDGTRELETIITELAVTQKMIAEAKELKLFVQRLKVKETDKPLVDSVVDKLVKHYGSNVGRSNFTVVHLPNTGVFQDSCRLNC